MRSFFDSEDGMNEHRVINREQSSFDRQKLRNIFQWERRVSRKWNEQLFPILLGDNILLSKEFVICNVIN